MPNLLMLGVGSTSNALTFTPDVPTAQSTGGVIQGSVDVIPYGIDFTKVLATGDNAVNPVVTVANVNTGAAINAAVNVSHVSVANNIVSFVIAALPALSLYRFNVEVQLSSNKLVSAYFTMFCPF